MNNYIATFYTQYAAIQFRTHAKKVAVPCRLAPVPRSLSSSCGTCAHYTSTEWDIGFASTDLQAVYKEVEGGYETLYESEGEHP